MRSKDYVDEQTTKFCEALSQRLSRRGLLGSVGRLALKVAGISLLPVLPVDRAFAQFTCGGDWQRAACTGTSARPAAAMAPNTRPVPHAPLRVSTGRAAARRMTARSR